MIIISYLKKLVKFLSLNDEYRLYIILKTKKKLENRIINGDYHLKNNEISLRLKHFILTKNISIIFSGDILKFVLSLENLIKSETFKKFLQKGKIIHFKDIKDVYKNKSPQFFYKLSYYNKKLEKLNCFLIVQGSYADNSFNSYSDVDLVIIGPISKEISLIKKQIENELIVIDPLQHHGVFYINSTSFGNYWQMDLPLATLDKSITFSRIKKTINITNCFHEKFSSFYWISNFIRKYPYFPVNAKSGIFFTKYFFSQLMLVPTIFLATKGRYVYKLDSFKIAKKYYSDKAWECIHIVSHIRIKWNQEKINKNYISESNTVIRTKSKEFNFFSDALDLSQFSFDELSLKYKTFVDETSNLISDFNNEF